MRSEITKTMITLLSNKELSEGQRRLNLAIEAIDS